MHELQRRDLAKTVNFYNWIPRSVRDDEIDSRLIFFSLKQGDNYLPNSMKQSFFGRQQSFKQFHAFYGTRRLSTVFTTAPHWSQFRGPV